MPRCRGKEILPDWGPEECGKHQAGEQLGGEGVLVSEGQAAVRAWAEDVGSLTLPPTDSRSVLQC